jgi:hypothetical protein
MKPRDWFGVGIRLLGVWMLVSCVDELRTIAEILIHSFNPLRTPMSAYVIHAIVDAVVGMYLLGGAPPLSAFAFPRRNAAACGSCGYDLTGNKSGVCPECGAKIEVERVPK